MRFCFFHLRRRADYLAYVVFFVVIIIILFVFKETTREVEHLLRLKRMFPRSWVEKGTEDGGCCW